MLRFKKLVSKDNHNKHSSDNTSSSNEEDHAQAMVSPRIVQNPSIDHDEILREIYKYDEHQEPVLPKSSAKRAVSVQRPLQGSSMKIVGTASSSSSYHKRAVSTERSGRSSNYSGSRDPFLDSHADSKDSSEKGKEKVSKTEKIKKLQAKNELYKVEYKRVQKDRKNLKKEIEAKNLEIGALNKEIDAQIAETSALKQKLAEAIQQIDEEGTKSTRLSDRKYKEELELKQREMNKAWSRVNEMRDSARTLKEQISRKDQQVEALAREVSSKENQVQELQQEVESLEARLKDSKTDNDSAVRRLEDEKHRLEGELGQALERAATMVKEREEAIADLLKENDDLKRLVATKEEKANKMISEEEMNQMQQEIDHAHAALEEAQDRVMALEEDIESWINRGNEMEDEIERLRSEIGAWQEKSREQETTIGSLEERAEKSEAESARIKHELESKEAKFKSFLAELEIKHRAAILDAREQARNAREAQDDNASISSRNTTTSNQAKLLEQAMSKKKTKAATGNGSGWLNSFIRQGEEEELSEDQVRIKELEAITDDQAEEIQKLKSELVRLKSSYNEKMYISKKKIEDLTKENAEHLEVIKQLQGEA